MQRAEPLAVRHVFDSRDGMARLGVRIDADHSYAAERQHDEQRPENEPSHQPAQCTGTLRREIFVVKQRTSVNFDLLNALNASPVLALNNNFGAWQRPTVVLAGRLFKVGVQFDI
jgi:hypothetical protein